MPKGNSSVAVGFLGVVMVSAPNRTPCPTPQQIRKIGEIYAHTDGFSGNVVVFRYGRIISNESYGLANIELDVPITVKACFAIGSVTERFNGSNESHLQAR